MKNCRKGISPYPLPKGGGGGGVTPEQVNQMIDAKLVPVNQNISTISNQATQASSKADTALTTAQENQVQAKNTAGNFVPINRMIAGSGIVYDIQGKVLTESSSGSGGVTPEQAHAIAKEEAQANFETNIAPINNSIKQLQQDVTSLQIQTAISNLNTIFLDYYSGIEFTYLMSNVFLGTPEEVYQNLLTKIRDINKLRFTFRNTGSYPSVDIIITKQQFLGFENLNNFGDYVTSQVSTSSDDYKNFAFGFIEESNVFIASNLDSDVSIEYCSDDQAIDNLGIVLQLTQITGFLQEYSGGSDNSLQNQILNVKNTADTAAAYEIDGNVDQGVRVSPKTNNKQTVSIDNASKSGKGVAQAGDNIDANNGVLSTQGGGQGTVKTVAGVPADASGNVPLTAGNVGAPTKAEMNIAIGGVTAECTNLQNQITTNLNNMKKISSVVTVDGTEQATSPIDTTTWKLPVPVNTSPSPTPATSGIRYWNFLGTPVIKYDTNIIPSVSNVNIKAPFPSKEINITIKIVNGFYSTTKYMLINTCIASKATTSTEEKKLISGAFSSSMTDAEIFSSLVAQTEPTNETQMDINWIVPPETQARGIQLGFSRSQFSAMGSMNGVANYLQTKLRAASFSELKNCLVNWDTTLKQFILFLNNGNAYFTYSLPAFNYPFNSAMKLNQESGATIGNPIVIGLTSVTNSTTQLARPSYSTNDSANIITVDTGFCSFKFDVSLIKATPTMIKDNQVVIKITAPNYSEEQVSNPNQYYNRYATNLGSDDKKWAETTNKLLDFGDITNSPQIVAEYSNNELNGTAERNLVELTLNYAKFQQTTSSWQNIYLPLYKSVIAPLNNYTLRITIIADDGIVPSPYTVNGAKTYSYDIAIQTSWYKNGQILTPFLIQCDNNNIQLLAYDLPISTIGVQNISYVNGESDLSLSQADAGIRRALVHHWQGDQLVSAIDYDPTTDEYGATKIQLDCGYVYTFQIAGSILFSDPFINNTALNIGLINENDGTSAFISVEIDPTADNTIPVPFGTDQVITISIDTTGYDQPQVYRWQKWTNTPMLTKKKRTSHKNAVVSGCWSVMAGCFNVQVTRS